MPAWREPRHERSHWAKLDRRLADDTLRRQLLWVWIWSESGRRRSNLSERKMADFSPPFRSCLERMFTLTI
jgi:hypothetical protein